jgi:hypothetical protein
MPSTTVTAFHVTQGRVEYESTIPQGTDKGLDLREESSKVSFAYMKIIFDLM